MVNTFGDALDLDLERLAAERGVERLLVVGGGYIGLEMGLVYQGLGSQVSVVEFFPRLLMGADLDLVDIMVNQVSAKLHEIMVDSKVKSISEAPAETGGFYVEIEHKDKMWRKHYDQVLVAIGRRPNTEDLGLEDVGVELYACKGCADQYGVSEKLAGLGINVMYYAFNQYHRIHFEE